MKYMVDDAKNIGKNWLVADMGGGEGEDGMMKGFIITTDHIRASEKVGDAKSDAELIVELLNMFCNEKEDE
jgi:hypothetical protein